ncbi:MAG: hypothetical protein SGPRY_008149, partial [Prymnesium sp.]
ARSFIEQQALKTGFAIQLAYRSPAGAFSIASGRSLRGKATPSDTFLFGSGTKPYTAASLFKLVDDGTLSLDAPAAPIIKIALRKLGTNETLPSLFGPQAARVTVGMLLRMQSGIADFDVPSFDDRILKNASRTYSPLDFLQAIARDPSSAFVCAPGNCTSYSSTNYILAGLVLLGASDASTWRALDQAFLLPRSRFPRSRFPTAGPINQTATVKGRSAAFSSSPVEIWGQDVSVLGWTCGNLVAPAEEMSLFLYSLLVERSVVSDKSLSIMKDAVPLNVGWAKGYISYGAGLMIQQTSRKPSAYPPRLSDWGAYLGHGGDTYGFLSEQGLLPQLNATFSVIANEDYYMQGQYVKSTLACHFIELAADEVLGLKLDLDCVHR